MYRQGLPASVTPERGELCFYAEAGAPPPGCLQRFSVDIVMSGRRATPKRRRVCEVCSAWLLQERLANVAPPLCDGAAAGYCIGICFLFA